VSFSTVSLDLVVILFETVALSGASDVSALMKTSSYLVHQREQLFQRELQQDLKKLLKNSQRFKMSLRKRRKRSLMKLKLRKKILPTSLKSSPISKLRLPLTLRN
jgi:hypothetical protein